MKKIIKIISLVVLISMMLVVSIPPAKAQFILASWDYPDEYGQGVEGFRVYENSTGDWVQVGYIRYWNSTLGFTYEWNESIAIKLRCYTTFNSTLVGVDDGQVGRNYLRHNVTVTTASETVFGQQNFTYYDVTTQSGAGPPDQIWVYQYEVVLNFLPMFGITYTATITYEVFY